jgi:hypothetical protein
MVFCNKNRELKMLIGSIVYLKSGSPAMTLRAMMYTLKDLEEAQATLEACQKCCTDYDGNNPDKYRAHVRPVQSLARSITESLKAQGLIPQTELETLEARLDSKFPKAGSKQVVELEGKRYQKQFYPLSHAIAGVVNL